MSDWPILMSAATAARYLDMSEKAFRQLAHRRGFVPMADCIADTRWRKVDLDAYVENVPASVYDGICPTPANDPAALAVERYRRKAGRE